MSKMGDTFVSSSQRQCRGSAVVKLIGAAGWWLKHAVLRIIDDVVARYLDWCEHAPDRGR